MNTIFLHIFVNFSVKLSFFEKNNEIFSIVSNQIIGDEISLKIEDFEELKVNVYPLNKNYLPYSLTFSKKNEKPFLSSNFATINNLPENNFVLLLKKIIIPSDVMHGDQLEITNSEIKKLTFLNDIKGRGKVENFKVLNNNLIKKEKYFVFLGKKEQKLTNELLLLDFFQSVYAQDFSNSQNNLSQTFASVLDKETIKTFFGNFKFCKIINYFQEQAVALVYEDEIKVFGAKIDNNKIVDIYQIN